MARYFVNGPTKLSGEVHVQGAKNSALKHVITPLLVNDFFVLKNIPSITSSTKPLKILELFGAKVDWLNNTVKVDSRKVSDGTIIPADLFYHTSGGILLIPIITGRFGKCEIERNTRRDTGGDSIGRRMSQVDARLKELGVEKKVTTKTIVYKKVSDKLLDYKIPNRSFGVTMLSLYVALSRNGISVIHKPCRFAEFDDIVKMLTKMGAKIRLSGDLLEVDGRAKLTGTEYENMNDKHDFVTFLCAALATESEIEIKGVQYDAMKMVCLENFLEQIGIQIEFDKKKDKCIVNKNNISKLKPADIYAGEYPEFVTEWQVLFSPLLALINGRSRVVEGIHSDRMRHWEELAKFGAKYKYTADKRADEEDGNPRSVDIVGVNAFKSAKVESKDVRAGAAMIIAAMAAKGESEINDPDGNIDRGYENLAGRFHDLGANIKVE